MPGPSDSSKCAEEPARYDRPMLVKRLILRLLAVSLFAPSSLSTALLGQAAPPTAVPAGVFHPTENTRAVSGVRVEARADGSVWFLLPANDRIARLTGETMRQWQIRTDRNLGAHPVDFEIEGDIVWFIETGQSQIDSNQSVFARLDTATGQLREWVVPGARPAGFHRTADGKVWLPQTDRRLQLLDLTSLEVVDYVSFDSAGRKTIAYADLAVAPDGALWLADFGNNRIVRYETDAATETSWTLLDPRSGFLNPSQIGFDERGFLWIAQRAGGSVDRFDPATGELRSYPGFDQPNHFDFFAGRVYVTEGVSGNGRVVVLDSAIAVSTSQTLLPQTLEVREFPNRRRAVLRNSTITPTAFNTKTDAIPEADLKVSTNLPGILRTEFPSRNAYGIDVAGGVVWVGSDGRLARILLQTIGTPADLSVPLASQFPGPPESQIRIAITLHNRGTQPITGEALYLFSAGAAAGRVAFTLAPGETRVLDDAFKDAGTPPALLFGPVRLRVTSGDAADLVSSVRTVRTREDGAAFGFAIPARSAAESLNAGASATLFTGARAAEVSVFGFFSPSGAEATATLLSPDGVVRGSLPISVVTNVAQEFNPAASAFGVAPQPGDVIRISVASGTLQPYVSAFDPGSGDVAFSQPVSAGLDQILPNMELMEGADGTRLESDVFLSNPDPANAASIALAYHPIEGGPDIVSTITLPPLASRAIANAVSTLFNRSSGHGALMIFSDIPIAASARLASKKPEGDYAVFAAALDAGEIVRPGRAGLAIGAPQTETRRTDLLLFNRDDSGSATVTGFDAAGAEVGRLTVPLPLHHAVRVNSLFAALGVAEPITGHIRVEVSEGLRVYAWTMESDSVTGDPEIAPLR